MFKSAGPTCTTGDSGSHQSAEECEETGYILALLHGNQDGQVEEPLIRANLEEAVDHTAQGALHAPALPLLKALHPFGLATGKVCTSSSHEPQGVWM